VILSHFFFAGALWFVFAVLAVLEESDRLGFDSRVVLRDRVAFQTLIDLSSMLSTVAPRSRRLSGGRLARR
jgi:hypothetical protein